MSSKARQIFSFNFQRRRATRPFLESANEPFQGKHTFEAVPGKVHAFELRLISGNGALVPTFEEGQHHYRSDYEVRYTIPPALRRITYQLQLEIEATVESFQIDDEFQRNGLHLLGHNLPPGMVAAYDLEVEESRKIKRRHQVPGSVLRPLFQRNDRILNGQYRCDLVASGEDPDRSLRVTGSISLVRL